MTRSFLFVPADSEKKLAKARSSGADALILDLEDAVLAEARPAARRLARDFLGEQCPADLWVRMNPLDSADALEDLRAVMPAAPCGIVLPKPAGARDVNQLSMLIDVLEEENELPQGQTAILPVVTEQPAAIFRLHEYADATPRLRGMAWGAEDISVAIGAATNRDDNGNWLPPYELVRSMTLFAAAAAGVAAIDTVYTDFRNLAGLAEYASNGRRDGFAGMLAIHPDQVDVINEGFSPSPNEIEHAQKIADLFAANPGAGVLGMNGEMIDRPHWLRAMRILELASRSDKDKQ